MSSKESFRVQSQYDPDTKSVASFISISCWKCHKTERMAGKNPGYGFKVFKAKGWLVGRTRNTDVCPGCRAQKQKRPELTKAQRRAAYNRIEDEMEKRLAEQPQVAAPPGPLAEQLAPVLEAMLTQEPATDEEAAEPAQETPPMIEAAVPKAMPPRKPTLADNRRIMDALEAAYDVQKGLYRGSSSDTTVANGLDVPKAWVVAVREQFFGAGTGNESAVQKLAKLDVAVAQGEQAVAKLLQMAADAETIVTNLKKQRDALQ